MSSEHIYRDMNNSAEMMRGLAFTLNHLHYNLLRKGAEHQVISAKAALTYRNISAALKEAFDEDVAQAVTSLLFNATRVAREYRTMRDFDQQPISELMERLEEDEDDAYGLFDNEDWRESL
jgi:hypothetical protein